MTPPSDNAAECAILGCVFLRPDSFDQAAANGITGDTFADPAHRAIWHAVEAVAANSEEPDPVTVSSWLDERKRLPLVGGYNYVNGLAARVPSLTNFAAYCRAAQEMQRRRAILASMQSVLSAFADDPSTSANELHAIAENGLRDAVDPRAAQTTAMASDLVPELLDEIEERNANDRKIQGTSTGFKSLDESLGGLHGGQLIVIAGRPGMGKSALAFQIANNIARSGLGVHCSALEMHGKALLERMIVGRSRVSASRLRDGTLLDDDWGPLLKAMDEAREKWGRLLHIDWTARLSVSTIRARARQFARRHKVGALVVDYLQLVDASPAAGRRAAQNRETEVAGMSREFKLLAKELNVPLLLVAQLNRGVEGRTNKRPSMSDLRESGAIEQDADVILFPFRPGYYEGSTPDVKDVAEIIIGKQRNGSGKSAMLKWHGSHVSFSDPANGDEW